MDARRDFRHIDSRSARVILVEAGPRVLAAFSESSSRYAARSLAALGVDLRLGSTVTSCDAEGVVVGGRRIASGTVLWAAGVRASRAGEWLSAETIARAECGSVPISPCPAIRRCS